MEKHTVLMKAVIWRPDTSKWMIQQQVRNCTIFPKKETILPQILLEVCWKIAGHRKQMKTVHGIIWDQMEKRKIPEKKQDGSSRKKTGIIWKRMEPLILLKQAGCRLKMYGWKPTKVWRLFRKPAGIRLKTDGICWKTMEAETLPKWTGSRSTEAGISWKLTEAEILRKPVCRQE